jgi:uncharacterized protein (TIGR03435 family)
MFDMVVVNAGGPMMTRSALVLACVCGAAALSAQAPAPPQSDATFEAASVKPLRNSTRTSAGFRPEPTRWSGDFSVTDLVVFAYQIQSTRIIGAPQWAEDERYEINARTGPRKPGDIQSMVRHLLAERFALKVHRERRPIPVYLLLMSRADGAFGPRLQRVERDCTRPASNPSGCSVSIGGDNYRGNGQQWANFVATLENRIGERPILDKTGLSGQFDIAVEWSPGIARVPEGVSNAPTLADLEARPLVFTAIREQLGLKLEPDTAPMDVLVIDSVDRPTPD